jgi:hypothetical protein
MTAKSRAVVWIQMIGRVNTKNTDVSPGGDPCTPHPGWVESTPHTPGLRTETTGDQGTTRFQMLGESESWPLRPWPAWGRVAFNVVGGLAPSAPRTACLSRGSSTRCWAPRLANINNELSGSARRIPQPAISHRVAISTSFAVAVAVA